MTRLRRTLLIASACLGLLFGLTWIFSGGMAFLLPIIATILTGLYILIWVYNRQVPEDPGGLIWREEHWRRQRLGLCLNCGYDLKGNESGVCPECGSATNHDKHRT
jgi:uncharacterized paraquat-inducible protein A